MTIISLLHFDGTDASTSFIDERPAVVWTAYNQAQLDTAQKKFGSASALFDGTTDYIETPGSVGFNFDTHDFTIELWVRRVNTTNDEYVFGNFDDATFIVCGRTAINATTFQFKTAVGPISSSVNCLQTPADGNFHHIAVVRSTTTIRAYLDGVGGTAVTLGTSPILNMSTVRLGNANAVGDRGLNGWIDEFRFSNTAKYTANFTPPASAFRTLTPKIFMAG